MIAHLKTWLGHRLLPYPIVWPPLEQEMGERIQIFLGTVLNAGSGDRALTLPNADRLINVDLPWGIHSKNIDTFANLDRLPFAACSFDGVICNAVLEHVRYPSRVLEEFHRVLKPGGQLYLSVPFLQPFHPDPDDFHRFTRSGLTGCVEDAGFSVEGAGGLHSVWHTLAWMVHEWLKERGKLGIPLRIILAPFFRYKTRTSRTHIDALASANWVTAKKPAE